MRRCTFFRLNYACTLPFECDILIGNVYKLHEQFDGNSDEQPTNPGRLRDVLKYPHTDKIMVKLWPGINGPVIYEPPLQVDETDLENI